MYCKNCGNELKENEKFCGNCGVKIDDNMTNVTTNNIENKTNSKEPIKIKFTHLVIAVVVLLILLSLCIVMTKGSDGLITKTNEFTKTEENNTSSSSNSTNITNKVDIKNKSTYITNNPIPEQMKIYPSDISSYQNTYNTIDLLALVSAKDYAEKNLNIQKITYMTICQRDSYGRYRIMIVYYTPTSKTTDMCVVYFYRDTNTGNAKLFFETNTILPNTGEWNTPLSIN